MRELRQPTLLSVFFVCIYSCPVSVLFGIGNAIGSSAIIRRKGQAATKAYRNGVNKVQGFDRKLTCYYLVISKFQSYFEIGNAIGFGIDNEVGSSANIWQKNQAATKLYSKWIK